MDTFITLESKNEHVTIRFWVVIAYFILRLLEDSFILHKYRHVSIHSTMYNTLAVVGKGSGISCLDDKTRTAMKVTTGAENGGVQRPNSPSSLSGVTQVASLRIKAPQG